MFRFMPREHDWSYYYNNIEAAERAYQKYNVDDNHNQNLIKQWEKCVDEASYYLNRTTTQEGTNNISVARETFLTRQKQFINQAKSQDRAELCGYGRSLKRGLQK